VDIDQSCTYFLNLGRQIIGEDNVNWRESGL
jgi:hypothetical protein